MLDAISKHGYGTVYRRWGLLGLIAVLWTSTATADTLIIDFDSLSDGDPVTTQFPGMTFSNATVLTAGISLNEFEFPPHSGTNVVFDSTGPITIDFLTPVLSFGAYFNYLEPLTITAFDSANNSIGSATSRFNNNLALSGDIGSNPNELLQVRSSQGITEVIIAADPAGSSFVLDDATIATRTTVPEPSTSTFMLLVLGCLVGMRQIPKRQAPKGQRT